MDKKETRLVLLSKVSRRFLGLCRADCTMRVGKWNQHSLSFFSFHSENDNQKVAG